MNVTNLPVGDRQQTLGESRVRLTFNPSGHALVDHIKRETAAMIDFLEEQKRTIVSPEGRRLLVLAQTHYEDAAMWAVKAVTG